MITRPLADRMRPESFADVFGDEKLFSENGIPCFLHISFAYCPESSKSSFFIASSFVLHTEETVSLKMLFSLFSSSITFMLPSDARKNVFPFSVRGISVSSRFPGKSPEKISSPDILFPKESYMAVFILITRMYFTTFFCFAEVKNQCKV